MNEPVVSVVIPMLNERGFIEECLDGFAAQRYPSGKLEVIVVDGGSTDGSLEYVEDAARRYPWLRVAHNPARRIPAGCNRGVEAAVGDVVCFFSSHGVPSPAYVARSVAVLQETGAAGVGGRYLHVGLDPLSRAVGLAMASPFGMASTHRFLTHRQEVDTISHPAYWRSAVVDAGSFDESIQLNEDYELNWRIRRAGGRLVFDPSITSTYRPRPSLVALARQFWRYGKWKASVARRHPRSLRARHVAPPAAVTAATLAPLLLPTRPGRTAVSGLVAAYACLLALAVIRQQPWREGARPVAFAAAFPVMHFSWGAGFLTAVLRGRPG